MTKLRRGLCCAPLIALLVVYAAELSRAAAQTSQPTMTVPNLDVRPLIDGFVTPISLAFLSDTKWLVIEKMTGEVKVVENGVVIGTALDLAVNNASERGLLGIAVHPDFESNGFVYLFWSCVAPPPPASAPFFPTAAQCAVTPRARRRFGRPSRDAAARQPRRPVRVG